MKLRPWRLKDAAALVRISAHTMDEAPSGYLIADTTEHARELIAHYQLLPKCRGRIYAVWHHLHIIGYVQLLRLRDTLWEVGYYVDESMRNHGYMSEALHHVLLMIQADDEIQEVQARVLISNKASRKVLEHNHFIIHEAWDELLCYRLKLPQAVPALKEFPHSINKPI